MSDTYRYSDGELPLLISVPHDGRRLPDDISKHMTQAGRDIPDTDWHVAELYDFVRDMGAKLLVADYSRYVVDLNRSAEDGELYPRSQTPTPSPDPPALRPACRLPWA